MYDASNIAEGCCHRDHHRCRGNARCDDPLDCLFFHVVRTACCHSSQKWHGLLCLWGGACSVLGGYVAARIAEHDALLNGALSSILSVGSGTYAVFSGSAADDLLMHIVFLPLSAALGTLGGYLRSRQGPRMT
ncbi:hypothetical protein BRAS3809_530008 [Bradyrhizobium sp. STM 3809]|nr:hypothetical protein BRAS3809_530008 [Bradyrhizobium sp. STM 3809]